MCTWCGRKKLRHTFCTRNHRGAISGQSYDITTTDHVGTDCDGRVFTLVEALNFGNGTAVSGLDLGAQEVNKVHI